jgi:putative lumazine-binding protein
MAPPTDGTMGEGVVAMSLEAAAANHIGPAPDRDEIIRVVRLYTDGFGARDVAMFREAFHPSARMFYTRPDGQLEQWLIADCIQGWANVEGHVACRILAVIQAGDVATVVLGFDADTGRADSWVDVHSLLRMDGTWRIMNKTATHASRADWAASGGMVPGTRAST